MVEDAHHEQKAWFKWVEDTSLFPVNASKIIQAVVTSVVECATICHATQGCQRFYLKDGMASSHSRCIMA